MSETAPEGPYVYQPHPVTRKDGRLWHVGGLPDGMTRKQAEAIVSILTRGRCPCGLGDESWHVGGVCNIGMDKEGK